ncbi:hypothetical protein N7539_009182 [Penicillium diatomitis]|uniref:Uncharacterized protein n=1 Tax=Penicillium diatomitis TaxID=2819901 RepID=A0A9W9WL78_9EURO|nr:uncharacterized protein N7539_009182 [Penicillium diatomitis]KAJ5469564.1 hypothetical protein N7539_009182 [Penicillium diatomitis]
MSSRGHSAPWQRSRWQSTLWTDRDMIDEDPSWAHMETSNEDCLVLASATSTGIGFTLGVPEHEDSLYRER